VKKKENLINSDKKDWEEYIKNPNDIFDKDLQNNKFLSNRERFKFDLHGHSLIEANQKVKEIINFCFQKKYREILFVTGKGIHSNTDQDVYKSEDLSKLRYSIPNYINSETELSNVVSSITPASKKDGGEGVLIIKLRKL